MRETKQERTGRAAKVIAKLKREYPDARCALDYSNPLELTVATILSAQCTDVRVNQVTPGLFRRYPTALHYAIATATEIEAVIRSTGFFRAKARSIRGMAAALVAKHGGQVPRTMEELTALPGVGRKTANVILGNAFDIPGIPVDTHVKRLANRLGFTRQQDPVKIESDLAALIPRERWTIASHLLIFHGRQVCHARKPECRACPIRRWCPSRQDA